MRKLFADNVPAAKRLGRVIRHERVPPPTLPRWGANTVPTAEASDNKRQNGTSGIESEQAMRTVVTFSLGQRNGVRGMPRADLVSFLESGEKLAHAFQSAIQFRLGSRVRNANVLARAEPLARHSCDMRFP
jgi:hypothetical protein